MRSVQQWLEQHGLGRYADAFKQHGIDSALLPSLTEQSLARLGVPAGDRGRILAALKARELASSATMDSPPSPASALPPIETVTAGGERRQLTVLYCDLVGSTSLSGAHDPEELWQILARYHEACVLAVQRYEGFVAQIQGDGILAYFGYPVAHENAAERAVHAGLDIVHALAELNVGTGTPLRVRIGIASGLVVVSHILAPDKSAVGETPNLAHRLQSVANPGDVLVSERTRRLAGGAFEFEDRSWHLLRGVAEPTRVWRVVGRSNVATRFEAATSGRLTPIVGREQEVAVLLDRWEASRRGEGQLVLVQGEPGIGKSRILREFRERVAPQSAVALQYQCLPYFANRAFYPIVDHVERAFGFAGEDSDERKFKKLEQRLMEELGRDISDCNLLGRILDLPCDQRYGPIGITSQRQKDATIELLADVVVAEASRAAVVVLFEDVHWADPSTVEAMSALVGRIASVPLLVVITSRPEFQSPWKGLPYAIELAVGRLSRTQGASLVLRVTQNKPLPADLVAQIVDNTDCVPLYLEEVTKAVLESTVVVDRGDGYEYSGAIGKIAVPTTLHDSLMARLDRLIPGKEIAQIGAVVGREFSYEIVAGVSSMQEPALGEALERLVGSELVSQRGVPPKAMYTFKHALVQDTAYDSLLKSKRQELHAAIAHMLEEQFAGMREIQPEILALHYERAGLTEEAVKWYTKAGEQARARSAYREAIQSFERSLSLLDLIRDAARARSVEIDIRSQLGMLYLMLEGFTSALAKMHLVRAHELGARAGHDQRFPALVGLVEILSWDVNKSEARSLGEDLLRLAATTGARVHSLYAHQVRGRSLMYMGRFREALAESQRAMEIYDQQSDAQFASEYGYDPGVFSLSSIAYSHMVLGYLEQAAQYTEECIGLARRIGHPYTLSFALAIPGADIWYLMRDPAKALQFAREGQEVSSRWGFGYLKAMCDVHAGWATAMLGNYADGLSCMTRALDTVRNMGVLGAVTPRMFAELASVYAGAGEPERALSVLDASPDRQPGRTRLRYGETYRIEGDLHRLKRHRDLELAESCYREAIQIAIEDEAKPFELRAATNLARLWQEQGKGAQARELLAPLFAWFTEGHDFQDLQDAKAVLSELDARQTR